MVKLKCIEKFIKYYLLLKNKTSICVLCIMLKKVIKYVLTYVQNYIIWYYFIYKQIIEKKVKQIRILINFTLNTNTVEKPNNLCILVIKNNKNNLNKQFKICILRPFRSYWLIKEKSAIKAFNVIEQQVCLWLCILISTFLMNEFFFENNNKTAVDLRRTFIR